jgi:hypothetical protein
MPPQQRVALLEKAGTKLFGDRWQQPLADVLGVQARTVRRWIAGDRAVSPHIIEALPQVLYREAQERRAVAKEIEMMACLLMSNLLKEFGSD